MALLWFRSYIRPAWATPVDKKDELSEPQSIQLDEVKIANGGNISQHFSRVQRSENKCSAYDDRMLSELLNSGGGASTNLEPGVRYYFRLSLSFVL